MESYGSFHGFSDRQALMLFKNIPNAPKGLICGITTKKCGDFRSYVCRESNDNEKLMQKLGATCVFQIVPQHGIGHIIPLPGENNVEYLACDAISYIFNGSKHNPLIIGNTGDCPILGITTITGDIISVVHISRECLKKGIIKKTINELCIGAIKTSDLICMLWGGICQNCYKVTYKEKSEFSREYEIFFQPNKNKWLMNLSGIIQYELNQSGIIDSQITTISLCPKCFKNEIEERPFWSYRNNEKQRNGFFIFIKK